MTSPQSREKLTSNDNFANSVTPIVPNAVSMRLKKKKHVIGDLDLEIWLMPSIEWVIGQFLGPQVPTWSSPWPTWTNYQTRQRTTWFMKTSKHI
jgi:hypothetical protein